MNSQYGRKWSVLIVLRSGETIEINQMQFEPEGLKVTFDINYPGIKAWYFSEIVLWNLSAETSNDILTGPVYGAQIYLSAGYQNGKYGQIFGGYIFQTLFERQNVTDYKLTIRAIDGNKIFSENFLSFTLKAEYTAMTLFNNAISNAQTQIQAGKISDVVKNNNTQSYRGITVFKTTRDFMEEFSKNTGSQAFVIDDKLNITTSSDGDENKEMAIVKSPDSGLIGTPVQIDYGVSFKCLLDSDIKLAAPPNWIKLDMSLVRLQAIEIGTMSTILDEDMILKIGGVRHIGDTRGNDWYTEVIGYTIGGKTPPQLFENLKASEMLPIPKTGA